MIRKYKKFYEENRQRLFSYLLRKSGDRGLAEELVQESFIRHFQRYRESDAPLAVLYTIARHALFDHVRQQRKMVPFEENMAIGHDQDGEHDLLAREEYDRTVAALKQLAAMDREILSLLADKGLAYAEIGKILGLTEGNVKVRVHRARLKLRQILAEGEKSCIT